MKSYTELEREAYMAGNTELANLYDLLGQADSAENLQEEIDRLRNIINDVAYTVSEA